jgi:hypothetical protein
MRVKTSSSGGVSRASASIARIDAAIIDILPVTLAIDAFALGIGGANDVLGIGDVLALVVDAADAQTALAVVASASLVNTTEAVGAAGRILPMCTAITLTTGGTAVRRDWVVLHYAKGAKGGPWDTAAVGIILHLHGNELLVDFRRDIYDDGLLLDFRRDVYDDGLLLATRGKLADPRGEPTTNPIHNGVN